MNDNTNFKAMLTMIYDMQIPIITVEYLNEKLYGEKWSMTHHIIIPDGKDKVTDFCFVDGHRTNNNYLFYVKSLNMNFEDAVVEFSKKTLKDQGARLTLTAI